MSYNDGSKSGASRRTFLKATGALGLPLVTTSTAFAKQDAKTAQDVRRHSLHLRRKNGWNIHQWRRYLANRDVSFLHKDVVRLVPRQSNDDVSSQELSYDDCYLYITVVNDLYKYVDFEWEIYNPWGSDPEDPQDHAAIAWDSDDYDKGSARVLGPYVSEITSTHSESPTGVSVKWEDSLFNDNEGEYIGSWFHQQVNPEPDTTKYGRKVFVDYSHTWNEINLETVSISSAGAVIFTYDNGTYQWVREADEYEVNMDEGETYKDSP